jgi:hypothetical protein
MKVLESVKCLQFLSLIKYNHMPKVVKRLVNVTLFIHFSIPSIKCPLICVLYHEKKKFFIFYFSNKNINK